MGNSSSAGSSTANNNKVNNNLSIRPVGLPSSGALPRLPSFALSKLVLDFNVREEGCPLNTPVFDEIEIFNVSPRKMKFKFDPVPPPACQLAFSPASATLAKGKSKKIKVKLILRYAVNINFKVTIRMPDGDSMFINVRVAGATGVFGVDPTTLELTNDGGFMVPTVLATMKRFLVENNGTQVEGIFRLAGEQTEIQRIKGLMNQKQFDFKTKDINAVASLIKVWFRDLPVPILNALPPDCIMNFSDARDCVEAYNTLPEPQKTLLTWLLDFLTVVATQSDINKMTSQNLAIVVAPNLYDISSPAPMEGLILSQKCAQFLNHVLNSRMRMR